MSDPLSQILILLRPRSAIGSGLELSGEWCFRFSGHESIKFCAVMRGNCWLRLEGENAWDHISTGDCFLLSRGVPFQLASDPRVAPRDATELDNTARWPIASSAGKDSLLLVGGGFTLDAGKGAEMMTVLPPVLIVRHASPHAKVLNFCLRQFADELASDKPGSSLLAEHLAQVMLVHLLRIYLAEAPPEAANWLRALGDKRLSRAFAAMHAEPAHNWSLQELANEAGMSRTSFAAYFKQVVGQSPMDYLTSWRMLLAKERLRLSKTSTATIAAESGYRSEASFSTAFKRIVGMTPRQARHT